MYLKITIQFILGIFIALVISSCGKDFPEDNIYDYRIAENLPEATTDEVNFVDGDIVSKGAIISSGRSQIIDYGHCWSVQHNPTIHDAKVSFGTSSKLLTYQSELAPLENRKTYYVRSFVTNEAATSYGQEIKFTTKDSIKYSSWQIVEEDILSNNKLDFGENVFVRIFLVNRGNFIAPGVKVQFKSMSNALQIQPQTKIAYHDIAFLPVSGEFSKSPEKDEPYTLKLKIADDAPEGLVDALIKLTIEDSTGYTVQDSMVLQFNRPFIKIKSPDEITQWKMNSNQIILWDDNIDETVKIELFNGTNLIGTLSDSTNSDGALSWNLADTLPESNNYWLKISSTTNPLLYDESPQFSIGADHEKYIEILAPAANSTIPFGADFNMQWDSNIDGNIDISLLKNSNEVRLIASNITNTGVYNWNIQKGELYSGYYTLRISSVNDSRIVNETKEFLLFSPPDYVRIDTDTFSMGFANDSYAPPHKVILSPFSIAKHEVTNAQFAHFLNDYGSTIILSGENIGKEMIWLEGDGVVEGFEDQCDVCHIYLEDGVYKVESPYEDFPVNYVSWYGAFECSKFYGGRLPSEAEWEYAARGGMNSTDKKYSGSDDASDVAWYYYNSTANNISKPGIVGARQANELGIYDMSGNVWEWCNDWYDRYYYDRSPVNNPQGPNNGTEKSVRGGGYQSTTTSLSFHNRGAYSPATVECGQGFRIAKGEPVLEPFIVFYEFDTDEDLKINQAYPVVWEDNFNEDVKIVLIKDNTTIVEVLEPSLDNKGKYDLVIPEGVVPGSGYSLKIIHASKENVFDMSDEFDIIPADYIIFDEPNSSSTWETGAREDIVWKDNVTGAFTLELLLEGALVESITTYNSSNLQSFSVPYGLKTSNKYQVRITSKINANFSVLSDYFAIKEISPFNILPYVPNLEYWNDKVIVTPVKNYFKNDLALTIDDDLYISYAILYKSNDEKINGQFTSHVYLDDNLIFTNDTIALFEDNDSTVVIHHNIGEMAAGSHTVKILLDKDNNINEYDENDNTVSYSFDVSASSTSPNKGITDLSGSLSDGVVAYFPFYKNEDDYSVIGNQSFGKNITLNADRDGNQVNTLDIYGDGFVEVPDNDNLRPEAFTISVWANLRFPDNYGSPILTKTSTNYWDDGYGLYYDSGSMYFFVNGDQNTVYTYMSRNKWYHIVAIFDGKSMKLYLDGELKDEDDLLYNNHSGQSLLIGKGPNTNFWNGMIDDLIIYNRALDENEVKLLYELK